MAGSNVYGDSRFDIKDLYTLVPPTELVDRNTSEIARNTKEIVELRREIATMTKVINSIHDKLLKSEEGNP